MVLGLIFSVCFIGFLLHITRSTFSDDKRCRARTSKGYSMEGKGKKHNVVPDTNRNASGRNWEMFKSMVVSSSKSEYDSNNISKKPHARPRKKVHTALLNMVHMGGFLASLEYYLEKVVLLDLFFQANIPQMDSVSDEVHDENKQNLTKHIAMDCEMVGIGDGTASMIARVSIVNRHGYCVYDKYVKPREPVTDYRTKVSGIRQHHLDGGEEFEVVQKEVSEILRHRVLIGHAVKHDLDVLFLSHPRKSLRDTSRFKPFRQLSRGNTPSLKKLAHELLGREIQIGEHSSVEDARAAMQLYVLYKNKWESEVYSKRCK